MFYTLLPNIENLQKQFKKFVCKQSTSLDNHDLISQGILLEEFLLSHINVSHIKPFNEKFISIKRSFVQRTVFLQYKNQEVPNEWRGEYIFTTEEQFVADCLSPDSKIIKYTAFALFTQEGKQKHKNHNIFHLPKSIIEKDDFISQKNNVISSNKITNRKGFDLTDNFPKKNTIDWNLSYCLYCHKRNKDSCSKGLNNEKLGCPLRQDISESIFLKKNNHHIAALAVIMRNNPLCILTGRRICNNCEEACIFQKQEAVDIQSIETQILNDVLTFPFGLEIYNTLLGWNPLDDKEYLNLTGKDVLVAGLGPAGLFTSYLLAKTGANIIGIDALNIEITPKIKHISKNIIKDIKHYINEPISQRKPSGIGGVMEYGITARWNKNYLDILIGLLLRRKNINFLGSKRIGGLLSYEDILYRYQFNHVALCVGSATPKIPFYCKGLFSGYSLTKGVIMASDFLMSLHLNRLSSYLTEESCEPIFVLGCGLTAIDTACEARAILKQKGIKNPSVAILYHKEYDKSSAYNVNHLEFKKALEEGVTILQNTELKEVNKKNDKIESIALADGRILPCKTLIIAIGTKPNHSHIADFLKQKNISLFGDCNPLYTGSVVNALASVRNGIRQTIKLTYKNQNTPQKIEEILHRPNIFIDEISNNLFKIKIFSPLFARKLQKGNVLKLQEMYRDAIAVTVCNVENNTIIAYLYNSNNNVNSLIQAILHKKTIHINGINCRKLPSATSDTTIVTTKKTKVIFKKIFPKNKILLPQEIVDTHNNSYLIVIKNENERREVLTKLKNQQCELIVYNKMNCMLGGICGRCIMPNGKYACVENTSEVF